MKEQTRITLVRPTTFLNMDFYPLNIGYIYASLSSEKHLEVHFVDGEKNGLKYRRYRDQVNRNPHHSMWREIAREILNTKPDIVGFSCYSLGMTATKYIASLLRMNGFCGQIWAGGIHPTTCGSETLESIDELDGVVIGEGEQTFKEVCNTIHADRTLSSLKGIMYKDQGQIKTNPARALIENLDDLSFPSHDFSGRHVYRNHIMLTSRGCPFDCDFCDSKNMWGRSVRYRSADNVVREIESIAGMGIKHIGLRDDTFTLNKRHVEGICGSILEKRLDRLSYGVGSRIDTIDDDIIELLKKMNVDVITFGVETGSPRIQKKIKKNLDISTVVPVVLKANEAGFRTITFFMLGHPSETEEDIKYTYSLIRDLSRFCSKRNFISINIVCPYPGTGYWDYACERHGKFIDFCKDSYRYYHQLKPFINITDMQDDLFYSYIGRLKRFANMGNLRYRISTAIGNPQLLLSKIRGCLNS